VAGASERGSDLSASVISGFRCDVHEIFALLGCYTALILLVNDVLGQHIGPIFKGQDSKSIL
jgi:hypothetical protein